MLVAMLRARLVAAMARSIGAFALLYVARLEPVEDFCSAVGKRFKKNR